MYLYEVLLNIDLKLFIQILVDYGYLSNYLDDTALDHDLKSSISYMYQWI